MNLSNYKIPSEAESLLKILRSCSIINVVRLLNWKLDEYMEIFGKEENKLFSLGHGPLYTLMLHKFLATCGKYVTIQA